MKYPKFFLLSIVVLMSIQALPAKLNDRIVSYLGHSPIKEKEIKRLSDFYTHEISLLQRLGFLTGTDQIDGDFPYPVEFYLKLIPNTITSLALKDILSSMEWGEEEKIVALVSSSATQPQLVCKHEHNEALHIHSLPSPFISCTKESLLTFDPEISKNDFSVLIISFPKFSTTVIRCHVLTTREQPLFNLDALAFTFEKLPSDSPYKSFLKEANQQPFGIKAIFLHEILKLISEAGQASQATRDAAQNLQKILDTHSMKTSTSLEPDPPLSASSPSLPPPPPPPPPPPSSLPLPLLSPSSASMLRAPVGKPAPAGNAVSKQLSHTDIIKNDSTIAKELGYEQQNMGTYNAAKRYAQKYSIGVPSSNEWQRLKREATQNGYQTGALVDMDAYHAAQKWAHHNNQPLPTASEWSQHSGNPQRVQTPPPSNNSKSGIAGMLADIANRRANEEDTDTSSSSSSDTTDDSF